MKYYFFIFLFFFNINYQKNIFDVFSNAYNEPLSLNFFANNKIATGGGILFIGIFCLQIKNINHIFKKDSETAELLSKKRNLTQNIHYADTDDEDSDNINNQLEKISKTEFNKKISQGCSHYLWVSFKQSLNPFQWFTLN